MLKNYDKIYSVVCFIAVNLNYILNEVKEQKSSSIILKNTKEEIAALLGVPRPSLSRELINLRDMNYIEFNRKVIKVLDIEGLEEELFM